MVIYYNFFKLRIAALSLATGAYEAPLAPTIAYYNLKKSPRAIPFLAIYAMSYFFYVPTIVRTCEYP